MTTVGPWRWILLWLRAIRAPFLTATVVPVLLGAAIAANSLSPGDPFPWVPAWWVLTGAMAAHAATNLLNDYGDHLSGNDLANLTPGPFNGGSRVIQDGLLPPWQILAAAIVGFLICIARGLQINHEISGQFFALTPLLVIGFLGILLGVAYTAPPLKLSYRGLGESAIALAFGPVIVLGTHYVLTHGHGNWQWQVPLVSSIPVAMLVWLIIWINQFQDVPADARTGKLNLVVRLARSSGGISYRHPFRIYRWLMILTFGVLAILAVVPWLWSQWALSTPWLWIALIPAVSLPWVFTRGSSWLDAADLDSVDWRQHPYRLSPVNASTIGIHLVTGVLMALGWLLEATIG